MKRRISVENGFELPAQIRFLFSSSPMGQRVRLELHHPDPIIPDQSDPLQSNGE
jgi:hypothetical protein